MGGVHETAEDIAAVDDLLERSMAGAGPHLRSIITEPRRVHAAELCRRLQGMCLLVLATTTADGRPLAAPVDGIFYRGAFHFSTSEDAVRMGHIRRRPDVSAVHLPAEEFAVTVHGRAVPVDFRLPEHAGFRDCLLEIYVPRYGPEWEQFLDSVPCYFRIDAVRMFTFAMRG